MIREREVQGADDILRDVLIRRVRDDERAALGAITVAAYAAIEGVVLDDEYVEELRDVETRARHAVVLVAVDDDGTLLGCVTYVAHRSSQYAEHEVGGAASIRMLAVAPAAQGRGAGLALVQACIDRACQAGCSDVLLHTTRWMQHAHRIYDQLGFQRAPELDWQPTADVELLGYQLRLVD